MKFLGALVALLCVMFSWCVNGGQTTTSCSKLLGKSVYHHPKSLVKGNRPLICVSNKTCCSRQLEESLQKRVVVEMKSGISTKYEDIKGHVMILHKELKGYFRDLIRQSFHKTVYWLSKSHKNLTSSSEPLLRALFRDMETFIADSSVDLNQSVSQFFQGSFPLLYPLLDTSEKTLSNSFKKCLAENVGLIQPFGDKPEELLKSLIGTLSPVQIFLTGLVFSANVITTAEEFNFTSGCDVSLLKMKYCPLCQGINDVKPCHRFCIDLMTSCLASEMQLHSDWNDYMQSLVSLAGALSKSDLLDFTSEMYKYLLNAASAVLISKKTLLPKVLKECGRPTYRKTPSPARRPTNPEPTLPTNTKTIISVKMEEVKPKVDFFADLFLDIPKGICVDDHLAASPSEVDRCWNGDAKASFTGLKNPGAFQTSLGDTQKLKRLVESIKDTVELVKTSTLLILEGSEDKSGSGDGSGDNEISGSGECSGDDEDCGSSGSGGGNSIVNTDTDDLYFGTTRLPQPDIIENDINDQTTTEVPKENPNVLQLNNDSPFFRCVAWQSFILASLVMVLL